MSSFNHQFVYSIIIIALGYLLKRFNFLKKEDGAAFSRIIFNLTLPCLLIVSFDSIRIELSLFYLIVISFIYGILMGFLGIFAYKNENRKMRGMLAMMVPGFNIGLFAFPLVEGIWGAEGLKYFSMFDMGNSFIVFGVIYLIAGFYSGDKVKLNLKDIFSKMSKSFPLVTYIIVIILNLIHIHLPETVIHVSKLVSEANMPLSLLLLGYYLNFTVEKRYLKRIGKYLALRYIVGVCAGIVFFFLLPFGDMFKYTVFLGLLMPTSFSVLVYAVEYNYDEKLVGTVTNLSILISFVILWGMGNILI